MQRMNIECPQNMLGADLRQNWTACLEQVGFHPSEPSIWILEGSFTIYRRNQFIACSSKYRN
jgi:O-methyltransferase involved in polyketide biosynthesis